MLTLYCMTKCIALQGQGAHIKIAQHLHHLIYIGLSQLWISAHSLAMQCYT